jgi:protocatechuate 3,4-dioxygenase beta subunit
MEADVRGEQIRKELTEGEGGVKMTIDIQVMDVKTCKPLQDVAVDFWSCNSTVGALDIAYEQRKAKHPE